MVQTDTLNAYAVAIATEAAAWHVVKDRLPGTVSYNNDLWLRWSDAIERTNVATQRIFVEMRGIPATAALPDPIAQRARRGH